jgi:hypothetical protein
MGSGHYSGKKKVEKEKSKEETPLSRYNRRMERFSRFDYLNRSWYEKAIPSLIKIFEENPQRLDGFRFLDTLSAYQGEGQDIITLKARPDGKFNVNVYYKCHAASNADEDKGIYTNGGKGYTAKEIFTGYPKDGHFAFPNKYCPQHRKKLIKEVKKRTGLDLKREVERRSREGKGLEDKICGVIGLSLIVFSLFFLSINVTGNAIGSLKTSTSNIIGVILLLFGIIGAFFYFRRGR